MSIYCAGGVSPPLNFVDWTMEYYLGWGENSCFKIAIEFPSSLQTALLSACYDKLILKAKQVICLGNLYLKKDLLFVLPTGY